MTAPARSISPTRADLEALATGRSTSLFARDVEAHRGELSDRVGGARVAIVGAAGSIGRAFVDVLLPFEPRAVTLLDLDENGLVEIVRDLRSTERPFVPFELAALPIGLGSPECERYLRESAPFDYVVNLAAMKHVRSEKDVYSLMRMVETNVAGLDRLLDIVAGRARSVFSVSSDKAVRPANLMGATKGLMEQVLLRHSRRQSVSTARFANVAFSNGSLPAGFLMRLEKRQPIAAPRDVERYFLSHEEAGQLCLLAALLGRSGDVYLPRPERLARVTLDELARRVLGRFGYEAEPCDSAEEARARVEYLAAEGRWPCHFTESDTTGEKPVEEFHTEDDRIGGSRYDAIAVLERRPDDVDLDALGRFLAFAERAKREPGVSKEDYVREMRRAVPSLTHDERHRSLDEKM